MDTTHLPTEETSSLVVKHVQELSINGDEPPPRYIRSDKDDMCFNTSFSSSVPIIDLHLLSSSASPEEQHNELEKLKSSLTSLGFFQAVGHDIPSTLLDEVQRIEKEFFSLSMEEKRKYAIKDKEKQGYLQGYGNDVIVSDDQVIDWSDRLYLMVKPLHQRDYALWPENPTGFREILNEYIEKVNLVAEIIMKSMAKSLGLEENSFISSNEENAPTFARFNYYPPCSRPDLVYGIKAHTDGGAITILLQDEVEGLQILKDEKWIKVPIIPNALLVNVADQVEIMSNGAFKSAMHRVITNSERARNSLAVFYIPEGEKWIEPAPELINESRPRLFKKFKSKDYFDIYFQNTSRCKRAIDAVRV